MAKTVLIVEDETVLRESLAELLSEEGYDILQAANGKEAYEIALQRPLDVVLTDVRMPEMDGLTATRAIKQISPKTCVVIITTHEHTDYLLAALKAGAAGYLLKDVTRQDLLSAVRRVLRGESILDSDVASRALQRLASEAGPADEPTPERLTPREREVLRLLSQGLTNREIAQQLTLSVGTVKIHVEHIIAKLGVSDRTQAAVRAVESGLFSSASR
jgi:DNA-binding NarL/FixJ family response regulator